MKIGVIIPVHNESRTLAALISSLKTRSLEVLVVDDGSQDNSREISQTQGASVISNNFQMGKGYCLRRGFDFALGQDWEGVITMDGDGQHDPDDIGNFLSYVGQEKDSIVIGNRMTDTKAMPLLRIFTNKMMSFFISCFCRRKIPDSQCGYRYIPSRLLRSLSLISNGYEIETEILMKASKNRFKIHSIPIKTIYAHEKSKINPIRDTCRFISYFLKEIFSK